MRQRLQQVVSVATWSEQELFDRLARKVDRELPGVEALVLDDTGFRKTGTSIDLPMSDEIAEALINYLRHRRPETERRDDSTRCGGGEPRTQTLRRRVARRPARGS